MITPYPRIRFHRVIEGEQYLGLRESISICFYMRRSHQDVSSSVLRALEVYRQAIAPERLAWYLDFEGYLSNLDAEGWDHTRRRLLDPRAAYIELRSHDNSMDGFEFSYRGFHADESHLPPDPDAACAAAFWLPTEYLEEHGPMRVRQLALELASGLPFNSGHAGLASHESGLTTEEHHQLGALALRYPGLDVQRLRDIDLDLGTRLKGVHWLNFLGPPVLGELGGAAGLRARLRSPDTTVEALGDDRAVVTLGEWPEAGDFEKGQPLPAYRELAQLLEPWLYMTSSSVWYGSTPEESRRWQRRFLDPPPLPGG
ncbi:MAG: DUF3396 domain-containing protein [Myxococcaceae bacterium]|nr:DUF3396 domain-containing protein [Myxococcaceae bacterium]